MQKTPANGEAAIVFHIAEPDAWATDEEYYKPGSFEHEGFVHLSTRQQVLATAQRYYAGRTDLLLLAIDVCALDQNIVYENLLGGEELFPHLYAEIPRSAILNSSALLLDDAGCFSSAVLDHP